MAAGAVVPAMPDTVWLSTSNTVVKRHSGGQGPRQQFTSLRCGQNLCPEAPSAPRQPRQGSCGARWSSGRPGTVRSRGPCTGRNFSREKKRLHLGGQQKLMGSTASLQVSCGEAFCLEEESQPGYHLDESEDEEMQGFFSCISQVVSDVLDDAVEEYTDEAVREIEVTSGAIVWSEGSDTEENLPCPKDLASPEPAEVSNACILSEIDEADEGNCSDDLLEEEMSVASMELDRGFDLQEEDNLAATTLADFIVRTPFHSFLALPAAATTLDSLADGVPLPQKVSDQLQNREQWPTAAKLEPCTRRAFRRRFAPKLPGVPVPEEPFPCDCLPLSRPVAQEVPPVAEVAAALSSEPLEGEAPTRLSFEAEERFCSIAASAFAALRAIASEEACVKIQRGWMAHKARQAASKSTAQSLTTPATFATLQASPPPAVVPHAPRGCPGSRLGRLRTPAENQSAPDEKAADLQAAPRDPLPPPTEPSTPRPMRPNKRISIDNSGAPVTPRSLGKLQVSKGVRTASIAAAAADASWAGLRGQDAASRQSSLTPTPGPSPRRKAVDAGLWGRPVHSSNLEAGLATARPGGPSAMELDLGVGTPRRTFTSESPRSRAGSGLLPALQSKAPKNGASLATGWTVDGNGSLSARGCARPIDSTSVPL